MNKKLLYLSRTYRTDTANCRKSPQARMLSTLALLLLPILIGIATLQTAKAQDGATLHEKNCIACHSAMTGGEGSVLYTRDDRSVKSQDALTKQVNRCQSSLGLGWTDAQISSVQEYLNRSFYKF